MISGADTLRRLYWDEGMSQRDIASELDVSYSEVRKSMEEHGIELRESNRASTGPWQDEEKLRELYVDEGLSTHDIGDRLGCAHSTIAYWLDKHDIDKRSANNEFGYAPFKLDQDGYEIWKTYVGGTHRRIRVHRLQAVAEFGIDAVGGVDVHHQNGLSWDNRPDNLTLLPRDEHARLHGEERADEQRELMQSLREEGKLGGGEVA